MPASLRHHFDTELEQLQSRVLEMGEHVLRMVDLAMETLVTTNEELCRQVVAMDDTADRLDQEIEHACLRLLALQQPMSRDLRIISTALKIITDLERIGDFAVDIAKTSRRLAGEPAVLPTDRIVDMANAAESLVREALRAYVRCDLESVHLAIEMDDTVDHYYDELFTALLEAAERDPRMSRQVVWHTHILRFLERIADHGVNVAERVYYMETGQHRQLAPSHSPLS